MDSNIFCELNEGIRTAFIDSGSPSNLAYRPEFVTNDYKNGIKVLSHIDRELRNCEEFYISVAFISKSGYLILSQTLQELALRGIKGKILTTDYLTFTDPEALDRIASFGNIELKIYKTSHENIGFHTKGYIFKNKNILRMIIGSSNMTQTALSTNLEWNTKLISTTTGEVAETIMREFNQLWMDKAAKTYEEFIDKYRHEFERHKLLKKLEEDQHRIAQDEKRIDFEVHHLKPNMM